MEGGAKVTLAAPATSSARAATVGVRALASAALLGVGSTSMGSVDAAAPLLAVLPPGIAHRRRRCDTGGRRSTSVMFASGQRWRQAMLQPTRPSCRVALGRGCCPEPVPKPSPAAVSAASTAPHSPCRERARVARKMEGEVDKLRRRVLRRKGAARGSGGGVQLRRVHSAAAPGMGRVGSREATMSSVTWPQRDSVALPKPAPATSARQAGRAAAEAAHCRGGGSGSGASAAAAGGTASTSRPGLGHASAGAAGGVYSATVVALNPPPRLPAAAPHATGMA